MLRQFPTRFAVINSSNDYNRTALRNGQTVGQKFRKHPQLLSALRAKVQAQGGTLSSQDIYEDCLCREGKPLDPEAVVPHDDPLGYIKRLHRRRGMPIEGRLNLKGAEFEPSKPKGPPIAEDILRKLMRQKAQKDPSLVSTPQKRQKLREDLINRHAYQPPPS